MLGLSILKSKVVIIKNNNKIFVYLLILYIHSKKNIFIDGKDKLFIRCSKESITKCYF